VNSPDPMATLAKVAESNQMTPEELQNMLQRNRQDLQMATDSGAGAAARSASSTLPRQLLNLIGALFVMIGKYATLHPRSFTITVLTLVLVIYTSLTIPKTGIVMSTFPKPLVSNGYSTFFSPPNSHLDKYLLNLSKNRKKKMIASIPKIGLSKGRKDILLDFEEDDDYSNDGQAVIEKVGRKSASPFNKELSFAITARKSIPLESMMQSSSSSLSPDMEQDIANIVYERGQEILSSRRFTEFSSEAKFHSCPSSKKSTGTFGKGSNTVSRLPSCIAMNKMGDLKRFGVQPFALSLEENVTLQQGNVNFSLVSFYTLKGGHFDGELSIALEHWKGQDNGDEDEEESDDEENKADETEEDSDDDQSVVESSKQSTDRIVVSVSIMVPKKGRKLSKKMADKMVSSLASSIASSILTESKQVISRKMHFGNMRKKVHTTAAEQRRLRAEQEQKMEEMSRDRKRRWKRGAGDGRYRPSGDRMRSPNNC